MITYVKKNFSLAPIVVLLLLFVSSDARFHTMVTKAEIEAICSRKYLNSSLCFEILKPTPETTSLDFTGLAKYLIIYQARNVSDAIKQFKLLERNTTDLQTIKLCEKLYGSVLYDKDRALEALAGKDYDVVNAFANAVPEMDECINEMSTMKPTPGVMITRSMIIKDISGIILSILECFIRESKINCTPDYYNTTI